MFYAALELRGCVEARQDEYLEAQVRYRQSLPRSWQVGKKAKELDRIFSQDKISKITIAPAMVPSLTVYHIPVGKHLVNCVDRLGNYLHAVQFQRMNDPWWMDFKALLLETYRAAWIVCQGSLLCPPFISSGGKTSVTIEVDQNQERQVDWRAYGKPGDMVDVHVDYPNSPPLEWVCDL
ncbi:hypothetical protein [Pseudaminobacter salicylatoxidans]|nr:hypothetical protein [Pseudaminobacter salicylatoxidans]